MYKDVLKVIMSESSTTIKTLTGSEVLNTIRNGGRGSLTEKHSWDIVQTETNIRRLTEIECERLQGFPDNWTAKGFYPVKKISQKQFNALSNEEKIKLFENTVEKKTPKGQRYKQCGNAVTTKIVKLIGGKLKINYQ